MESPLHSMINLFAQLGLSAEPSAIDAFVATHALPGAVSLADAPFWTSAQADFLREEVLDDGDWAEVVDALNLRLHS